jgi:hypothetical protein
MSADPAPPTYTEQEEWVAHHRIKAIETSFEMTGADRSQEYIKMTDLDGKSVRWRMESFSQVARLATYVSATSSLVEPKEYDLSKRIQKRKEWEKSNARELAEYKRLKAKYGD